MAAVPARPARRSIDTASGPRADRVYVATRRDGNGAGGERIDVADQPPDDVALLAGAHRNLVQAGKHVGGDAILLDGAWLALSANKKTMSAALSIASSTSSTIAFLRSRAGQPSAFPV